MSQGTVVFCKIESVGPIIKQMDCAANHTATYKYCPECGAKLDYCNIGSYAAFKQWLTADIEKRRAEDRPFSVYSDEASKQYSVIMAIIHHGLFDAPHHMKHREAAAREISRALSPVSDTFYLIAPYDQLIPSQYMLGKFALELRLFDFDPLAESNYDKLVINEITVYATHTYRGAVVVNAEMYKICNIRARRLKSPALKIRTDISLADIAEVLLNQ